MKGYQDGPFNLMGDLVENYYYPDYQLVKVISNTQTIVSLNYGIIYSDEGFPISADQIIIELDKALTDEQVAAAKDPSNYIVNNSGMTINLTNATINVDNNIITIQKDGLSALSTIVIKKEVLGTPADSVELPLSYPASN